MDTKWNKYKRIRIITGFIIVILATTATLALLPQLRTTARTIQQKDAQTVDTSTYDDIAMQLYGATYVLYLENLERMGDTQDVDASMFAKGIDSSDERIMQYDWNSYEEMVGMLNEYLDDTIYSFTSLRQEIDYAVFSLDDDNIELLESNTSENLSDFAVDGVDDSTMDELKTYYGIMVMMSYDANGVARIDDVYTSQDNSDLLLKKIQTITKSNYFSEYDSAFEEMPLTGPKNMTIVFGIPYGSTWANYAYNNAADLEYYYGQAGGYSLYLVALLIIFIYTLALIPVRKKEKLNQVATNPKYPTLELAVIATALLVMDGWEMMQDIIWKMNHRGMELLDNFGLGTLGAQVIKWMLLAVTFFLCYEILYISIMVIEEVAVLGWKEWIQKRSAIYVFMKFLQQRGKDFKRELADTDLSEDVLEKLKRVLAINFVVLIAISACWVFGWILLVFYTVVVYYLMKKEYIRIKKDYNVLCNNLGKLANGKVDVELPDTLGQFNKANEQMKKVKKGFAAAVKKEVSSQNMKTELITNVSHDLKTPLTAITTYVGLLKQDNVTPEEQKEYVDVLDKKSKRMKELIDDIFDISKANSNNLELDLRVTDICKLIRQVVAEREDELEAKNLQVRYQMPEGELATLLDGQKAYRIYENLLVNVEKYALEGTRVFIKVYETNNGIVTAICNTSREELDFDEEIITERFTRGDSARNTPGSGLGLAIAKSFAEAMKGNLNVSVDGDMFKVSIFWNK